jgi:hypothetical protein
MESLKSLKIKNDNIEKIIVNHRYTKLPKIDSKSKNDKITELSQSYLNEIHKKEEKDIFFEDEENLKQISNMMKKILED